MFVDVDCTTFNIDVTQIAQRLSKRTKAILPVHLFGLCADVDAIAEVAPGIPIVEDAACASGSGYKGRHAGSLGIAAAFSFHPRKSITTGEGGMVTTDNEELAKKVNSLRNHGASISEEEKHHGFQPYVLPDFNLLGFNYRMTDLQGALGIVQLSKLDNFIEERRKWATYYTRELADVAWLRTPLVPEGYRHGWQAYVCYIDESRSSMPRNELMKMLYAKGIHTRPGTHAVPMLGFYRQKFGFTADHFPRARDCARYSMAIPLHNRMAGEDYEYVVKVLKGLD
jgi:dTDP-4-amino-4,6-dideoxygalactose transaminase